MSAGMIWYKTQPDSAIASSVNKMLFEFCGTIKSHDTTVKPPNVAMLISRILSRSDTVIIVGGQDCVRTEENMVFILSRALGIPLEERIRSRSNYFYDTISGIKLPSLAGSVLFPSRFGGPEGIMLFSGKQTVIVLPSEPRAAMAVVGSMRKFLAPMVSPNVYAQKVTSAQIAPKRDYEKFRRADNSHRQNATRVYSESALRNNMENTMCEMRRRSGRPADSIIDDDNRRDPMQDYVPRHDNQYYKKCAKIKKIKNIAALSIVLGSIFLLAMVGSYSEISIFASSASENTSGENITHQSQNSSTTLITSAPSSTTVRIVNYSAANKENNTRPSESTTISTSESIVNTTAKSTAKKTTAKTTAKSTTKQTTAKTTAKSTTKQTTTKTTAKSTTKQTTTKAAMASDSTTNTEKTTVKTTTAVSKPNSSVKTMRIKSNGKVVSGNAAQILASIVEAEMGSSYNIEALKAQAVASYTYYLYCGGSSKTPSFVTKTPSSRSLSAAKAVVGKQMKYKGKTPYTPYYAISAGMTASNSTINGTSLSYLKAVDCSVDKNVSGYKTTKTYSAADVAKKVKSKTGISLTSISDKSKWFNITKRDSNNLYVEKVSVGGKSYTGSKLWLSVLGSSYVRSACYYISYNADTDKFTFTSYGYGHGVGMSQKGANAYAAQGKDYKWILKHFYSGVTIV